jgi:hypothetical protein
MAYVPIPLTFFVPPIDANGAAYEQEWLNHDELYDLYEGAVASHGAVAVAYSSASEADAWRFTSRGGADSAQNLQLRLTVLAEATGDGGTVKLVGGTSPVSVLCTGGLAEYTIDATPAAANEQWTITLQAEVGGTVKVWAWTAHWLPAASSAAYASGWRAGWSGWYADDVAVHTEGIARLVGGPSRIARDRPICIFAHFARIGINISGFSKVGFEEYWGTYDRDFQEVVGIGRIPRADIRPRTYRVDWYLRATGAATAQLTIGGQAIDIATPNAWGTATFSLSQGDHPLYASVMPATGQQAYFEAIQIWRQAV